MREEKYFKALSAEMKDYGTIKDKSDYEWFFANTDIEESGAFWVPNIPITFVVKASKVWANMLVQIFNVDYKRKAFVHIGKSLGLFPLFRQIQITSFIMDKAKEKGDSLMIPSKFKWQYALVGGDEDTVMPAKLID